jgi:fatty-acyl-CoA synthase
MNAWANLHLLGQPNALLAPSTEAPRESATVGRLLARAAEGHGGELALAAPRQGVRWSWRELDTYVRAAADGLSELGLSRGDRVGVRPWKCLNTSPTDVLLPLAHHRRMPIGAPARLLTVISQAWLPNVYEYVVLQYAAARIGAVLVTLSPEYSGGELRHALALSGCRAMVMVPCKARKAVESQQHVSLTHSDLHVIV